MISALRKLSRSTPAEPEAAIPHGQRVYAVGDIHGRLDLFDALLAAIDADDAGREIGNTTLILLGDLVDRGPDSAGVLARARQLSEERDVRILMGNHEEMFLDSFDDLDILRHFLRYGGQETLLSYDIDETRYRRASLTELLEILNQVVPQADRDFMDGFENSVRIGDYVFVHAGIRPGVPLDEQKSRELRWIREPFLSHRHSHGAVIVHGHTISDGIEHHSNRIGIDTGAYASGRLTALGLEGTARWIIEAVADDDGTIATAQRSL